MEKTIRFGIQLPQEGIDYEVLKTHWLEAERLGYDHLWLVDHLLTVGFPHGHPQPECWTTLSALAEATKTVRLGSMVMCQAFRNPALLANMAATLDRISKGRLEFAVGAGWYEQEFGAYGYDFPRPGIRFAQLEEAIQIYKALWTQDKVSFEGKYYKVKDLTDSPKPVQQPYPRFWIGGAGEQKTLRLVAKHADVWNCPNMTLEEGARKIDILKQYCQEIGRDFNEITLTWYGSVFIDEDAEKVWERLRKRAEKATTGLDYITGGMLAGDPQQIADKIRQYNDLGVTEFVLLFGRVSELDSTRLFAQRVFPMFDHPLGPTA